MRSFQRLGRDRVPKPCILSALPEKSPVGLGLIGGELWNRTRWLLPLAVTPPPLFVSFVENPPPPWPVSGVSAPGIAANHTETHRGYESIYCCVHLTNPTETHLVGLVAGGVWG